MCPLGRASLWEEERVADAAHVGASPQVHQLCVGQAHLVRRGQLLGQIVHVPEVVGVEEAVQAAEVALDALLQQPRANALSGRAASWSSAAARPLCTGAESCPLPSPP